MKKPTLLNKEQIDLTDLKQICQDYINYIDNDEEYSGDNDYSTYIFETAMQALLGKDVFEYVNERQP